MLSYMIRADASTSRSRARLVFSYNFFIFFWSKVSYRCGCGHCRNCSLHANLGMGEFGCCRLGLRLSLGSVEVLGWKSLWTCIVVDIVLISSKLLFCSMGDSSNQSRLQMRFVFANKYSLFHFFISCHILLGLLIE
jgi:hypothetical protein